jgi:hypothetical protein
MTYDVKRRAVGRIKRQPNAEENRMFTDLSFP